MSCIDWRIQLPENISADTSDSACLKSSSLCHFLEIHFRLPPAHLDELSARSLGPKAGDISDFALYFIPSHLILHKILYYFPHYQVSINILFSIPDAPYLVKTLIISHLYYCNSFFMGLLFYTCIQSKLILYTEGNVTFQKCELINITLLL